MSLSLAQSFFLPLDVVGAKRFAPHAVCVIRGLVRKIIGSMHITRRTLLRLPCLVERQRYCNVIYELIVSTVRFGVTTECNFRVSPAMLPRNPIRICGVA
jgi:hypothetical protein